MAGDHKKYRRHQSQPPVHPPLHGGGMSPGCHTQGVEQAQNHGAALHVGEIDGKC